MNTAHLTFDSEKLHLLRHLTRQTFRSTTASDNEKFSPHVLYTFIRRHNSGDIDTSFYQEYINYKPLQAQLYAFGLDPDQFFYLILFFKDYYNTLTQTVHNSALEDLLEIANLIYQSTTTAEIIIKTQTPTDKIPHFHTFTSPLLHQLMKQLPNILQPHLQDILTANPEFGHHIYITYEKPNKEKITLKQYMFYESLSSLLKPLTPIQFTETPDGTNISLDKDLLISRCVALIGLINNPSDKQKYLKPEPETTYNKNKRNPLLDNISSLRQNKPLIKLYSPIYDHVIIDGGKDRTITYIPHKPKSQLQQ